MRTESWVDCQCVVIGRAHRLVPIMEPGSLLHPARTRTRRTDFGFTGGVPIGSRMAAVTR